MTTTPLVPRGPGAPTPTGARGHLAALSQALEALYSDLGPLPRWARDLASVLTGGGRLLAVGNGGSAAQAQHLTSELVGRYCTERQPFSALALHADTSSVTAIANDYGVDEVFGRQVMAHGRPGDVLVALSTSGHSPNVVAAVRSARRLGLRTWALTGPAPNPLHTVADDALAVEAASTATVQEVHLVAVHLLCELLDEQVCR
ncbi:MAG TPA: SIS domain-containing protein [Acidimicrobiales bacterium]|jgi:D-sedoheptulose 7-phosphate isomerase|nr:SIS domain-containing protein [Acidimicrobiales bacterium]